MNDVIPQVTESVMPVATESLDAVLQALDALNTVNVVQLGTLALILGAVIGISLWRWFR